MDTRLNQSKALKQMLVDEGIAYFVRLLISKCSKNAHCCCVDVIVTCADNPSKSKGEPPELYMRLCI